jgi:alkanesulfonate monooxygenase
MNAISGLLDYRDIGVRHFLFGGFELPEDAITYARDLLPLVHEVVAGRDAPELARVV